MKILRLCVFSCFEDVFLKVLNEPLLGVFCTKCHQSFLKWYGVEYVCSCCALESMWSHLHSIVASLSACLLLSMFALVRTLWSVELCATMQHLDHGFKDCLCWGGCCVVWGV